MHGPVRHESQYSRRQPLYSLLGHRATHLWVDETKSRPAPMCPLYFQICVLPKFYVLQNFLGVNDGMVKIQNVIGLFCGGHFCPKWLSLPIIRGELKWQSSPLYLFVMVYFLLENLIAEEQIQPNPLRGKYLWFLQCNIVDLSWSLNAGTQKLKRTVEIWY